MDELFVKAYVDESEKEHIARPNLTALQDGWLRLKKNKAAVVCLFTLIAIGLLAILAPEFSRYSYKETNYDIIYQIPSMKHLWI